MSRFRKVIEQNDTGLVFASVYSNDGKRVGFKYFEWPFFNQEKRLKRANLWADKWVSNCEKYTTDDIQ